MTNYKPSLDHIYYNVNFSPTPGSSRSTMSYSVQLNSPILERPEEFSLAIVRFDLAIADIPFTIFRIQEGLTQNNPNLGIHSFTLSYGGNDYTSYTTYGTIFSAIPTPIPPSQNNGTQYVTEYYYIYIISEMLTYFNNALSQCVDNLLLANPMLSPLNKPYLRYDATTKLINFYVPSKFETSNVELWYNQSTYNFIFGFTHYYNFGTVQPNKQYRLFINTDVNYSNGYTPYGTVPVIPPIWYVFNPDLPQSDTWLELKSIVLKTSLIPIRNEYSISVDNYTVTPEPILTDFSVPYDIGNNPAPISFVNQGNYRYIDLLSENPLSQIDIAVFWKDRRGVLRPMISYISDKISNIKLAFIRDGLVS